MSLWLCPRLPIHALFKVKMHSVCLFHHSFKASKCYLAVVYLQISAGLRICGCNHLCPLISAVVLLLHPGPSEELHAHEIVGRAMLPG